MWITAVIIPQLIRYSARWRSPLLVVYYLSHYTSNAWHVNFNTATSRQRDKTYGYYVRAVRGGQYVLLGDLGNLCIEDYHCDEGEVCVEGVCETDTRQSPRARRWPVSGSRHVAGAADVQESPMYLDQNYSVLWTFSDDYASCPSDVHAHCRIPGSRRKFWTALSVTRQCGQGYAYVDLPIESLQNATTYAFRYSVTDCASQTTQSAVYYFRVATSDAPPVITGGPFVAAGSWPALPTSSSRAFVLDQNYNVLWTFSDDYAYCAGCARTVRATVR